MIRTTLILSFCTLLITSCGSNDDKKPDKEESNTEQKQTEPVPTDDSYAAFDHEHHSLPSPLQIALLFQESGLYFDKSVVDHAYEDNTNYESLLAMGKITAQLAYSGLNGEKDMALQCMEIVSQLADKTGFGAALITEERIQLVEQNIETPDSMIKYMSEMQYDLDTYIVENDEEARSLIVFSAAWIETLEMGRKLLQIELSEALILQLLDQHSIAHTLVDLLKSNESFSNNKEYQKLVTGVEKLEHALGQFGNLGGDEIEIKQESFDNLINTIKLVHKEILQ